MIDFEIIITSLICHYIFSAVTLSYCSTYFKNIYVYMYNCAHLYICMCSCIHTHIYETSGISSFNCCLMLLLLTFVLDIFYGLVQITLE